MLVSKKLKSYLPTSCLILGDRPWPVKPVRGQANSRTQMEYYLYILKSLKDGNHYVGITNNLKNRLEYHNKGKVKSTKGRLPFEIIYTEKYVSISEARKREVYLKSYKGSKDKMNIIENCKLI
jgi:putative endonuclease